MSNSDAAVAAIKYALKNRFDEPLIFLELWREGNFETIREEWPDVPQEVFIGADPLHPETEGPEFSDGCDHEGFPGGCERFGHTVETCSDKFPIEFRSDSLGQPVVLPHPDDEAVDRFAQALKEKLAQKRKQGYAGWDDPQQCSIEYLQELLHSHLEKGDPVDVGNFAMMLWNRGGATK